MAREIMLGMAGVESGVEQKAPRILLARDRDCVVALVRGLDLNPHSARVELGLCSLDGVERATALAFPTPAAEFWWTVRARDGGSSAELTVCDSLALAAGLISANHVPEGWLCGALISDAPDYYLSVFSSSRIYGRMTLQSSSTERLGVDLRQALNLSLPLSAPAGATCDALYVTADVTPHSAARLAEALQTLVEPLPSDRQRLIESGLRRLSEEFAHRCG